LLAGRARFGTVSPSLIRPSLAVLARRSRLPRFARLPRSTIITAIAVIVACVLALLAGLTFARLTLVTFPSFAVALAVLQIAVVAFALLTNFIVGGEPILELRRRGSIGLHCPHQAVVMLSMLQIILCHDPIAGGTGVPRELQIFFINMRGRPPDFQVRARALEAAVRLVMTTTGLSAPAALTLHKLTTTGCGSIMHQTGYFTSTTSTAPRMSCHGP
jgi:hypothetical protein